MVLPVMKITTVRVKHNKKQSNMVLPVMKITTVRVKHNKKHKNILYFFFNYEMLDIYICKRQTMHACKSYRVML